MGLLKLFLLMLAAFLTNAFAEGSSHFCRAESLFGADKGHHFTVCAVTYAAAYYAAMQEFSMSRQNSVRVSVGIAFTVGAAKEIYDKRSGKGNASWLDLAADTAGIALAALLLNLPYH